MRLRYEIVMVCLFVFAADMRYVDPSANAPMVFVQRITEIVALEADTIKWEKMKKARRKFKISEP